MEDTIEYICFICTIIPIMMMMITLTGRSRQLMGFMALGIFISLLSSEVSGALIKVTEMEDMYVVTTTITPIVEEILKAVPVLLFAFLFSDDKETLLSIAFAVGVGFAVLENIVILIRAVVNNAGSVSYLWAVVRGLGSGLMHAVTTMMIGVGMSQIKKRHKMIVPGIFAMIAMAAIYHAIYNSLVQTDLKYLGFVLPLVTYLILMPRISRARKRVLAAKLE
ncbi:MAG: PrsW family intramembrane metalloprotease [Eubacterium sp.]|nr:PrsW family intramembrane metalloprotease [Eubacterium sp.]